MFCTVFGIDKEGNNSMIKAKSCLGARQTQFVENDDGLETFEIPFETMEKVE
jgi:hypothetical protein